MTPPARPRGGVRTGVPRDGRRYRGGAIAEANRVDLLSVAMKYGVADGHASGREALAGSDGDGVGGRVLRGHVERLGRRDADSPPLADGEVVVAAVAADHPARAVEDARPRDPRGRHAGAGTAPCPGRRGSRDPGSRACGRSRAGCGRRSPAPRAWSARSAGNRAAAASTAAGRRACSSGPWRSRRRRRATGRPHRRRCGRSGR